MAKERWKAVVGWEGLYEISDQGRLRSLQRTSVTKAGWSRTYRARIRKLKHMPPGYLMADMRDGDKQECLYVHRVVLCAFVGPPTENAPICRHLDGVKTNNHVRNLVWGTPKENSADMVRHGTRYQGSAQHLAKMTPEKVRGTRLMYESGMTKTAISRHFDVHIQTICAILSRTSWKHVK